MRRRRGRARGGDEERRLYSDARTPLLLLSTITFILLACHHPSGCTAAVNEQWMYTPPEFPLFDRSYSPVPVMTQAIVNFTTFNYVEAAPYLQMMGSSQLYNITYGIDHNTRYEESLRLTQSRAGQVAATWYRNRMPVSEGFRTRFRFRVSRDHSRVNRCYDCLDANTQDATEQNILTDAGEGFAFVIFNSRNGTGPAMGTGGPELGYGSLRNLLAVEFDIRLNPEYQDPSMAHVSVRTVGDQVLSASHVLPFTPRYPPSLGTSVMFANGTVATASELKWVNQYSLVNYMYANVTPPYNFAHIPEVYDERIHSADIAYNVETKRLTVRIDQNPAPVLDVRVDLRNTVILNQDPHCPRNQSCLWCTDDYKLPTWKYSNCRCNGQDGALGFDIDLKAVNYIMTRDAYRKIIVEPDRCYPCQYRVACGAWVGFTASTSHPSAVKNYTSNIDIIDWYFEGSSFLGNFTQWTQNWAGNVKNEDE